jgi:inner membrane protein
MMGKSHAMIGMASATTLIAAGVLPFTPEVMIAAAFGSLLPDIDIPYSALGAKLPFVSWPLYKTIGHRTGTHSLLAIFACVILALILETYGWNRAGLGLFVGYTAHIAADLLTIEGCALLYPWDRARYSIWPAIRTGGFAEPFVALSIAALLIWGAWYVNPGLFDVSAHLRSGMLRYLPGVSLRIGL